MPSHRQILRALLPAVALTTVAVVLASGARDPLPASALAPPPAVAPDGSEATVSRLDAALAERWRAAGIEPAGRADDLEVLRRAWLGLAGTIPSVEEIRRFEADGDPGRLGRWIALVLADRRSADHLARRLAHALVGDAAGQVIVFRRDRFTDWLAARLLANDPFDRTVTAMVAHGGLWTEAPEVNFVTQAMADGTLDANVLAGRVARVLLGQRIDCAQCHDHPFAPITQRQYEGLAACFGQVRVTGLGVEDDPARVLSIDLPAPADGGAAAMAPKSRKVPPRVPYGDDWQAERRTHRENLAAWLVDPRNRRFHRAVVNRAWAIVYGRGLHEPLDDLPDPPADPDPRDPLDLLAEDFREHGCDLRRLLSILARARPFHLSSRHPLRAEPDGATRLDAAWGAFPVTPLGPDVMIAALVQATSLRTIDRDSHLLTRTIRFFREVDFLRDYGPTEDANGDRQPATIPQTLVRMNGRLARELVEANPFTAPGRIAGLAADDEQRLDLAFLTVLTRHPSPEERSATRSLITAAPDRGGGMQDLFWALTNSVEFGWNH
ncbi:MAG: DUF1549 domain-containing protein [Planctomycetes bacterium]|nr:DUF1549 domain-containing protein [Planctomycetota bacterium]